MNLRSPEVFVRSESELVQIVETSSWASYVPRSPAEFELFVLWNKVGNDLSMNKQEVHKVEMYYSHACFDLASWRLNQSPDDIEFTENLQDGIKYALSLYGKKRYSNRTLVPKTTSEFEKDFLYSLPRAAAKLQPHYKSSVASHLLFAENTEESRRERISIVQSYLQKSSKINLWKETYAYVEEENDWATKRRRINFAL